MELTPWVAPAAAVLAAVVVAWIGASNRRALAQSERRANIDAQLSDKRQKLYAEVLEPFLIAITPDIVWNTDPATKGKDKQQLLQEAMLNMRYRQAMFQLTFIGTDEVVERSMTSCSTSTERGRTRSSKPIMPRSWQGSSPSSCSPSEKGPETT